MPAIVMRKPTSTQSQSLLKIMLCIKYPKPNIPSTPENLQCKVCGKKYVCIHALQKHERKNHGIEEVLEPASTEPTQDHLYNYAHQLLILLLLREPQ